MSAAMQPSMWCPGINLSHPRANGLVCALPMWEGDGDKVMDYSGNGNHGTLTNMDPATDWVATEKGWALDFVAGASQSVECTALNLVPPFSFCTWARGALSNHICGQQSTNDDGWRIHDQANIFRVRYQGTNFDVNEILVSASENFHLGFTHDGFYLRQYVQGELVKETSNEITATYGASVFRLGYAYNSALGCTGKIFNSIAHNRTLTPSEIQQLYAEPYALYRKHGGLM